MPDRANVDYRYDGSYEGLLCCVFESFEKKERPLSIRPEGGEQLTLYPQRIIRTELSKARRVEAGVRAKASNRAGRLVELGYYTCCEEKELLILDFIRLAMRYGQRVLSMLADDTVNRLNRAVQKLRNEAHQYREFVRFSVQDNGVMTAVIEPQNFVLPLIAPHFCDRYPHEAFLIYDETHGAALVATPGKHAIVPAERYEEPEAGEEELAFRALWKLFYDTIAIEGRENPRCRMTHMPQRFWKHMPEMQG
ncbi:MAG TPA: TIGR03915 family putative DNA repair protein [Candidatus Fimivicinus intestinavium]|nr:TIGR03915 family putative DNA repair protein [Candidatus Fimivicinus intestinavium]